MISEKSKSLFLVPDGELSFAEELAAYLRQRLRDEQGLANELYQSTSASGVVASFLPRPVLLRIRLGGEDLRCEVKAVGKESALVFFPALKSTERINFNHVTRWKDVSDEKMEG